MALGEIFNTNPNPFTNNLPSMGFDVIGPSPTQPVDMRQLMMRLDRMEEMLGLNRPDVERDSLSDMLFNMV